MIKIEHTLRYDAPPAQVFAMLSDASFREEVCRAQHATQCDVTIDERSEGTATGTAVGMTVVVDQQRPSDGIPAFAQKFVGDTIHIRQHEEWRDGDGADLEVTIPGKPGRLDGTITLRPDGDGTVETVSGELKVSIPLVGGKVEVLIAELLEHALQSEERVGRTWLSR
jgi:hypothetical protein